jgi:hypothetical protein
MPWQLQAIIGLRKINSVKHRAFVGSSRVTSSARTKMIAPWFEEMGHCLAETAVGGDRRWAVQRAGFIVPFFVV